MGMQVKIGLYNHGEPYRFEVHSMAYSQVKLAWIFLGVSLVTNIIVFPIFKFSPPRYNQKSSIKKKNFFRHTKLSCFLQVVWVCFDGSLCDFCCGCSPRRNWCIAIQLLVNTVQQISVFIKIIYSTI